MILKWSASGISSAWVRTVFLPGNNPKEYRPDSLSINVVRGTPDASAAFFRDILPASTMRTAASSFDGEYFLVLWGGCFDIFL